jgi:3-deoxy-D-manno-octulosonate 8-phosphate phosphatase (KDO 8-P phosphatase)
MKRWSPDLLKRAGRIRLFATDVDGVLTDGAIVLLKSGEEVKAWSAKDRMGFFMLKQTSLPFRLVWITGRRSQQVRDSAKDVGVDALYQNCHQKGKALRNALSRWGLSDEESLFIGDDWVDIPALQRAGLAICPSDAHPEIKKICHWVTEAPGGRGVFREVLDLVFHAQGLRKDLWAQYAKG